jgi:hypothetical protein
VKRQLFWLDVFLPFLDNLECEVINTKAFVQYLFELSQDVVAVLSFWNNYMGAKRITPGCDGPDAQIMDILHTSSQGGLSR